MEESDWIEIREGGAFIWKHQDRTFQSTDEHAGKWARKGDRLNLTETSRNGQPMPAGAGKVLEFKFRDPETLVTANGFALKKVLRPDPKRAGETR